ncbi:MAG TPA: hypothetical protein VGP90_01145, partial [Acidimicrobiia bacterium]|nr:hypothetical protein [Acidimicrobiia bacterium]
QGQIDPSGMREFVVGLGGGRQAVITNDPPAVGSQKQIAGNYGVLKMTLHDTSYDWQYLSAGTAGTTEPAAGTVLDSGSDTCRTDVPTTATTAPGPTVPNGNPAPSATPNRSGYWMVGTDGKVYNFGIAQNFGNATLTPGSQAVHIEPTVTGDGYWIVDSAGGVASLGDAVYRGAPAAGVLAKGETVTSLSSTRTGAGYWMFTNLGRVLPFGDAKFFGDMSKVKLNGPVRSSVPTPTGNGYYMVASDGGIFAFGDARFYGSTGNLKLNRPIVDMAPSPDGDGYWMVASDGGLFAFGGSQFYGSPAGTATGSIVSLAATPTGNGYWIIGNDGSVYNFGSAQYLGGLGGIPLNRPIVGLAVR